MKMLAESDFKNRDFPVSLLVFHCFALSTLKMLSIFKQTGTGIHYVIQRNGKILSLVAEDKVASHAGLASWRKFETNINAQSIGIELQNSQMGQQKYTKAQISSLIKLAGEIIKRHNIKPENIVGHSDIAPYRKPDPAKFFPWQMLAEKGIGIWPAIKKDENAKPLNREKARELLEAVGYDTLDDTAALYAFVTRFLPQKVQVRPDVIATEAEVFAYWRGVAGSDAPQKLKSAPKIYPSNAEDLWHDNEVMARLKQIAAIYDKK